MAKKKSKKNANNKKHDPKVEEKKKKKPAAGSKSKSKKPEVKPKKATPAPSKKKGNKKPENKKPKGTKTQALIEVKPVEKEVETPENPVIPPAQPQVSETPSQQPVDAAVSDFEAFADDDAWIEDNPVEGHTEAFEEGFDTYAESDQDLATGFLPPVPDSWKIDVEDDMSILMFTQEGAEVLNVPLTENFLENFLPPLNQLHLSQSEAATSWQIRLPEDSEQPPVFSMVKNGAVAASLPLTEDVIEELLPALKSYDVRGVPVELKRRTRVRAWFKRHRFWGTVLVIIIVPVAAYIVFAIGQQIFSTPLFS